MSAKFRRYDNSTIYGSDYNKVRSFLFELDNHNYHFGRWDWMCMSIGAGWVDPGDIGNVGIWEDNNKIVAISTYDSTLGSAYLVTQEGYGCLKEEMLIHAKENLKKDGQFRVLVLEGDAELQEVASNQGFFPTQDREWDSIFQINQEKLKYDLPKGFHITSFNEDFDIYKYGQSMWKGFNHEMNEEGPFSFYWEKHADKYKRAWEHPNVDLGLKVFVVAPNGDFVSHCGMWYEAGSKTALVEPVATEPAYRKMGLGKAAVLEGIKRCGELGAERAFVGSAQQFYYNIGFTPYTISTWWKEKEAKVPVPDRV